MKLDEVKIQHYLSDYLLRKGRSYTIPNVSWSWLRWEADLVSITRAYYLYEYEIKTTRADFENDFLKPKHKALRNPTNTNRIPNYFSYVAPLVAMPLCVPDYAGIIEARPSGRYGVYLDFIEVRRPKILHRTKQTPASILKMLRTLMFKYWNLTETLEKNKIQTSIYT
jgi:hypothetical protein